MTENQPSIECVALPSITIIHQTSKTVAHKEGEYAAHNLQDDYATSQSRLFNRASYGEDEIQDG